MGARQVVHPVTVTCRVLGLSRDIGFFFSASIFGAFLAFGFSLVFPKFWQIFFPFSFGTQVFSARSIRTRTTMLFREGKAQIVLSREAQLTQKVKKAQMCFRLLLFFSASFYPGFQSFFQFQLFCLFVFVFLDSGFF